LLDSLNEVLSVFRLARNYLKLDGDNALLPTNSPSGAIRLHLKATIPEAL
jgi:hypothetical protein